MLEPELLTGLSVYQDVVLDGRVVHRGRRDCAERWELLAEHLPTWGAVIDVGSNFGWFGAKICDEFPGCVVASVEADLRSAAVQRRVLAGRPDRRICLLAHKAGTQLVRAFGNSGQRFEAALCLSVLHWLKDHRSFLQALGKLSKKLFVELPDPREAGAGVARIRREIGPVGAYLADCFPDRTAVLLGTTASHHAPECERELWMIGPPDDQVSQDEMPLAGLELDAMCRLDLSWPPRSWWLAEVDRVSAACRRDAQVEPAGRWRLGPSGLSCVQSTCRAVSLSGVRRRLRKLPETDLLTRQRSWRRRLRSAAASLRNLAVRRTRS